MKRVANFNYIIISVLIKKVFLFIFLKKNQVFNLETLCCSIQNKNRKLKTHLITCILHLITHLSYDL